MAKKVKIQKGDRVVIISGLRNDRGKDGEVIKVLPKENRVVVQKLNIHKKHQAQQQYEGRTLETGIIEFEAPLSISNVMLICPNCKQPTRVKITRSEDGIAHRVCKKCNEEID